jgi:hypothetical protein
MRRTIITTAVCLLAAMTVTHAAAASPHWKQQREPVFTDLGTTLNATGAIAGLGNGDVTVVLDAAGIASVECENPGGNVAPGQDTEVTTSGSVTVQTDKNGNARFSVTTAEPVVGSDACPNPQWTAHVVDVDFSGATITVSQGGVVVLVETFT